jgi:hypothetical protein
MSFFKRKHIRRKSEKPAGKTPEEILAQFGFSSSEEVGKLATQLTAKTTVERAEKTLGISLRGGQKK